MLASSGRMAEGDRSAQDGHPQRPDRWRTGGSTPSSAGFAGSRKRRSPSSRRPPVDPRRPVGAAWPVGLRRRGDISDYILIIQYNLCIPGEGLPPPGMVASPGICSLRAGGWRRRHIGGNLASSAPGSLADRRIDIDAPVRGLCGLTEEEIVIVEGAAG
jgi:hypothetical protein